MNQLQKIIPNLTLRQIIFIGLAFRLIAVFYSEGYAFHDDHFEMAELVQRWKDGVNFLWTGSDVHVFSLLYPGFLYLVFDACRAFHIQQPEDIMFVVRLLHALFSLLGIYYAWWLTFRLGNRKDTANIVALLMALFWIFPFMSVRTLREFVCVPFLLAGSFYITATPLKVKSIFLGALFFAVAFSIRLQTILVSLGVGVFLLLHKKSFKPALLFALFFLICFLLTQGLFDFIYYGNPLASILEYTRFNADPANIALQPQGPWYQYIGTVAAVIWIFPFLFLTWGFIYSYKKSFQVKMMWVGSFLFFAFHCYYNNKQERFILPFIPYFFILGVLGWQYYYSSARKKNWLTQALKFTILWFLFFNIAGLFITVFSYSKRSRVEAMIYLRKKGDVTNLLIEGKNGSARPPLFYLGKHFTPFELKAADSPDILKAAIDTASQPPNYVIMSGDENFNYRLQRLETIIPGLKHETDIKAGFVDNIFYWLNPRHNQNETWHIYRVN